ncbi:BON1-associated protein 2-like [Euphorbia lathyris]|uniref:BON1-associated protein 2-like n=1 Tax=Euphorbia lathyris TaxID=212925 RepID=UPI003313B1DA
MESSSKNLEITVLSAENLRLNGKPVKKDAFVVVKTDNLNCRSTRADHEGGSNLIWNQKLEMEMASHSRFITVQVECRINGSENRLIGTASIPVSDFSGGYFPINYLHLLSYRLRDGRGEKNGIINVSVKVVKGLADYVLPPVRKNCSSSSFYSGTRWGSPVQGNSYYHGGGVVSGVPVWCATRA